MLSALKKELVSSIFRFKNIGMTFPTGIDGDVNLAEIVLLKGIADKTLDSDGEKIQKALCVKKAAVSQMLGVLEKKGYINRETNKANRRKIILTLTHQGEALIAKTEKNVDALLSNIISRLGKKNIEQMIILFNQFADVVGEIKGN
jgi:DNA-binding MarR family transcriptional regulator